MSHVIKYWDYPADMDRKEIKSDIYMSILDDVLWKNILMRTVLKMAGQVWQTVPGR
ncbi:hypothetical protein [Anaerovibrio sp.]|uniref:hypothetical protein n=1 Tax=Anaerovibrio sp. TaxID=1872532 RepID=UPI0025B99C0A|nr:hypothetical protein [Anaerovibrio sp.]MBR2142956.1 hypothetical protein [Anaerovibrio sp.]